MNHRGTLFGSLIGLFALACASTVALAFGCYVTYDSLCADTYVDSTPSCADTKVTNPPVKRAVGFVEGKDETDSVVCSFLLIARYPDPCCDPCAETVPFLQPINYDTAVGGACP